MNIKLIECDGGFVDLLKKREKGGNSSIARSSNNRPEKYVFAAFDIEQSTGRVGTR